MVRPRVFPTSDVTDPGTSLRLRRYNNQIKTSRSCPLLIYRNLENHTPLQNHHHLRRESSSSRIDTRRHGNDCATPLILWPQREPLHTLGATNASESKQYEWYLREGAMQRRTQTIKNKWGMGRPYRAYNVRKRGLAIATSRSRHQTRGRFQ